LETEGNILFMLMDGPGFLEPLVSWLYTYLKTNKITRKALEALPLDSLVDGLKLAHPTFLGFVTPQGGYSNQAVAQPEYVTLGCNLEIVARESKFTIYGKRPMLREYLVVDGICEVVSDDSQIQHTMLEGKPVFRLVASRHNEMVVFDPAYGYTRPTTNYFELRATFGADNLVHAVALGNARGLDTMDSSCR
jgi:hypothetical protein